MSAQQPDASSRGHRSTSIAHVGGQRAVARLVAAGEAVGADDHDVGRRGRPRGPRTPSRIAARTRSAVSGSPATTSTSPSASARAQQRGGRGHAGLGGGLRAARRRRARRPSSTRRRSSKNSASGVSSMPSARRRSATADRQLGRHDGAPQARAARTAAPRARRAARGSRCRTRSARRRRGPRRGRCSTSGNGGGDALVLEHVGEDDAPAARLGVGERVADRQRDRVAHVRRPLRVAVDEEVVRRATHASRGRLAPPGKDAGSVACAGT